MAYLARLVVVSVFLSFGAVSLAAAAGAPDDRFLAGYAAAVLGREFHVPQARIVVRDGAILIDGQGMDAPTQDAARRALATAPGVRAVTVLDAAAFARFAGPAAPVPRPAGAVATTTPPPPPGPAETQVAQGLQILPRSVLFKPLRADPRWPHFSATYQHWTDDRDVKEAGVASFGETIPLVRDSGLGGQWEVGIQGGVFAVFDLAGESADLINADYFVGLPLSYRQGNFSFMFRPYHQSSHLGDEYILRKGITKAQRVNLSYEVLNAIASYDFGPSYRVYGGAGWLFDVDPGNLDRWMGQVGAEYRSTAVWWDAVRPVAALDMQFWQQHSWEPNLSLRAGVELENVDILSRRIMIAGEYFHGHNPNGQFITRDLQFFGIGIHAFVD